MVAARKPESPAIMAKSPCPQKHDDPDSLPEFLCRQCHPELNLTPEKRRELDAADRKRQANERAIAERERTIKQTQARLAGLLRHGEPDAGTVQDKIAGSFRRKLTRLTQLTTEPITQEQAMTTKASKKRPAKRAPTKGATPRARKSNSVRIEDLHKSDHPIAKANAASWDALPGVRAAGKRAATKADKANAKLPAARKSGKPGKPESKASGTRANTKQAQLIELLKRPEGATIDEIVKKFDWQAHTVRGALAGALKKKLGLNVQSEKVEGRGRVYRIA